MEELLALAQEPLRPEPAQAPQLPEQKQRAVEAAKQARPPR